MANRANEVLNAVGMRLPIFCGGMSWVGFGISGTFVGTVTFQGSFDGVNFQNVNVQPFPSGANQQTTNVTGNFFLAMQNYIAMQALLTAYTSGGAVVQASASIDSSYQNAFLGSTSQFVEQDASAGASNVITIAGQANRAWRCRKVSGGFSAAPAAAVKLTIADGGSAILWSEYVSAAAGQFELKLPPDSNTPGVSGGGVVNTPGNSLVITLAAPGGSVASSLSAEIIPA
jgi:hypothetical protein